MGMSILKQIFVLLCILFSAFEQVEAMASFGTNKPHYLFHLGDRGGVSLNLGWGYWVGNGDLRLKYQNTDRGLYSAMQIHDGQSFFASKVDDRRYQTTTDIKYLLDEDSWQAQFEMQNNGNEQMTWFTYTVVENNDYRLVDHEKYTSFIFLKPKIASESKIIIDSDSKVFTKQAISISRQEKNKNENKLNIFGITANISETFALPDICKEFKHLVQIHRGEEIERTSDNATLSWQQRQLNMMSENQWQGKSYVVMFTYGTIQAGLKNTILMTNSTQENIKFNTEEFSRREKKISARYAHENQEYSKFLQHVVSNLYGGITFYFGRLYTQNSLVLHSQDYSYSFTPSRLIFPRSFLWDDGFHQSVVVHYDENIVIDMLQNWMNKVDLFGWIGREQIRGGDITSMMPDSRFVFQDWFEMNPPTLLLPMLTLIEKHRLLNETSLQKGKFLKFLKMNYRKLQKWYQYFKSTQSHQSLEYEQLLKPNDRFYRWQCKDQCSKGNFMGSGLDDYPRMNNPSQISKQHIDLVSWLYFFSDSLSKMGEYLQQNHQEKLSNMGRRIKYYKKENQEYLEQIYEHMYDKSDGLFKDVAVRDQRLFIQEFVDVVGYVNLFPFMTGMLRDSGSENNDENKDENNDQNNAHAHAHSQKRLKSLKSCIEIMRDEKQLMSKDGLRSLSLSDKHYGTEDNYWRGAVWLPINFMVLRACKLYYWNDEAVKEEIHDLYETLRENIISSVHGNYKETGYLFENYYEGKGHRGFPFYGWTSLVTNIITEKY